MTFLNAFTLIPFPGAKCNYSLPGEMLVNILFFYLIKSFRSSLSETVK